MAEGVNLPIPTPELVTSQPPRQMVTAADVARSGGYIATGIDKLGQGIAARGAGIEQFGRGVQQEGEGVREEGEGLKAEGQLEQVKAAGFEKLGQGIDEANVPIAEAAARGAVSRNPDGSVTAAPSFILGKGGQAYAATEQAAMGPMVRSKIDADMVDLRTQYQDDPQGFQRAAQHLIAGYGQTFGNNPVGQMAVGYGQQAASQHYVSISDRVANANLDANYTALTKRQKQLEGFINGATEDGRGDAPEVRQWQDERAKNQAVLVSHPLFKYSADQAHSDNEAFAVANAGYGIGGKWRNYYLKTGDTDGALRGAEAELDKMSGLSVEQRNQIMGDVMSKIRGLDAVRWQKNTDLNESADALRLKAARTGNVQPSEIETMAQTLDQAKLYGKAADVRESGRLQGSAPMLVGGGIGTAQQSVDELNKIEGEVKAHQTATLASEGAGAPGAPGGTGGAPPAVQRVQTAILGQESGNQDNAKTSVTGATGPGQVQPGTFAQYAKPGESIDNPTDNRNVSNRIVADYMRKYDGDPARVAVAYFSGEGNVAPAGSPTPYLRDAKDPTGKSTSSYVSDVLGRVGAGGAARGGGQALLAIGTNDFTNEGQAYDGVKASIAAARAKGYDPVIVLPNKTVNGSTAAYDGALRAAEEAKVKTEYPSSFSAGADAIHMSPAAAAEIKAKYPGATPMGDSNAVRLGAKEGETGFTGIGGTAFARKFGAMGASAPAAPGGLAGGGLTNWDEYLKGAYDLYNTHAARAWQPLKEAFAKWSQPTPAEMHEFSVLAPKITDQKLREESMNALAVAKLRDSWETGTLAQQQDHLASEQALVQNGGAGFIERQAFEGLAAHVAQKITMAKDNPVGYAQIYGSRDMRQEMPQINPPDFSSPDAWTADIQARQQWKNAAKADPIAGDNVMLPGDKDAMLSNMRNGSPQQVSTMLSGLSSQLKPEEMSALMQDKDVKDGILAMGRNPLKLQAAWSFLDGLQKPNPLQFKAMFGEDAYTLLQTWRGTLNLTPEQSTKVMMQALDPAQVEARDNLRKIADETLKSVTQAQVIAKFNTGLPLVGAMFGATGTVAQPPLSDPGQISAAEVMRIYFVDRYREAFAQGQTPEEADTTATNALKIKFQVSPTNGNRVMANAPEFAINPKTLQPYYPQVGGSYDWMGKQLDDEIAQALGVSQFIAPAVKRPGVGTTADPVVNMTDQQRADVREFAAPRALVPDTKTEADIASGRPPSYHVVYVQPNGQHAAMMGPDGTILRFRFDPAPAQAELAQQAEQQRAVNAKNQAITQPMSDAGYGGGL